MDKSSFSPLQQVDLIAQLADIKDCLYRSTLGLTSLIETLVDKGVITREDLLAKAKELEIQLLLEPDDYSNFDAFMKG
jgi:hypothetical protein